MNRPTARALAAAVLVAAALPVAAPSTPTPVSAATSDLLISEYVEGSSNNKAIEIYNGTGAAVDLAAGGYSVQTFFNGSATAGLTINLTGTVADGDVFVLAQSSANATILGQADQTNGAGWFNGDDAVVLRKGTTSIDALGQVGFDPGTEWGTGSTSTADNTLRRLSSVCAGDPDAGDAFDPTAQWTGFEIDTFGGLGAHAANCGAVDVAPTVVSTSPADGATNVPVGTDVTVAFSEAVDVAAGAVTVECPTGTAVAANAAAAATTSLTIDPPAALPATTACTIAVDTSGVTDVDGPPDALVGTATFGFSTGTAVTPIHAIQGGGAASSPGTFTVEAVVVGDYQTQGSGQLRGFFLQEEDADADADAATSEGIFVFCNTCPVQVTVGDAVRVTGASSEFFGMTQLTASAVASVTVLESGVPLPTPATLELPVPGVPTGDLAAATAAVNAYFEASEGMLVTFPDTLSVAEYFELARYGQLILTEGGRPRQFTDTDEPSAAGLLAHEIELLTRTVILDDADNRQNRPVDTPNTAYYHPVPGLSVSNTVRGGDTIDDLTGVLHWSFAGQTGTDAWRIRPVVEAFDYEFAETNPRPAEPDVGGSVAVASFNVLNYFLTIDTTSSNDVGTCGPSGTADCRGADSAIELERQRAKLTRALLGLDADVVGLIEMENTPGVTPQQAIADDLNAELGAGTYAIVDTGVIGTDAIRVGLIYRPAVVVPVGEPAILDSSVDPRFVDTLNRPALAQTFEEVATGARFTVVVNHLKSKGSGCGAGDDDTTTGQGNCNATRTLAAEALADWLADDPTGSGDADVLIIGDLNSYAKEDPIVALQDAGYTDLVRTFGGEDAYSYVFDGQLGYLDHAFANPSLLTQVTGVTEWHVNADEVPLLDYNDDVRDAGESAFEEESDVLPLYAEDPYRTSDHDPVLVGLDLDAAPTVGAGGPYTVAEGSDVTLEATGSDPDGGTVSYAWDLDGDGTHETPGAVVTFSAAALDGPTSATVGVQATDDEGSAGIDTATVQVTNEAPTLGPVVAPDEPARAGIPVTVSVGYTDPAPADTHTAVVDWGDGTVEPVAATGGSVTATHTYADAGFYGVEVTVTDDDGGAATATRELVVVDPAAGSLVGAGWYQPAPGVRGLFGLVAIYLPSGDLAGGIRLDVGRGGPSFDSTSLEWLVVQGDTARLRAVGRLDGRAGYVADVTVVDGRPDHIQIVITSSTGDVVYDSGDQPVRAGTVIIL